MAHTSLRQRPRPIGVALTHECSHPGCDVFPFATAVELAAHEASGKHTFPTAASAPALGAVVEQHDRFETVGNGFGGTTTRRAPAPAATRPATEKMVNYLRLLVDERKPGTDPAYTQGVIDGGFDRVKVAIDRLIALPKIEQPRVQRSQASHPDVPAGRYAVTNGDDVLRFYRVDRPTQGKWEGFTFVKVMASDTEYPVKGQAAAAVLAKIADDPAAAMQRYGQEIGRCGRCNRTLTDETSRSYGIGPECRSKM